MFGDGNVASNPDGAWSYGTMVNVGAKFTKYTQTAKSPDTAVNAPALQCWSAGVSASSGVCYNPNTQPAHPGVAPGTPSGTYTVPAQSASLHPGPKDLAVARWTATKAGAYQVAAVFTGQSGYAGSPVSTTAVTVAFDASLLAGGFLNLQGGGNTFKEDAVLRVRAGDTIDFAVANGNGAYAYDSTGLTASVCPVTAPALVGFGEICEISEDCANDADYCLVSPLASTGYCTSACLNAKTCPAGWACNLDEYGATKTARACVPMR